MVKRLLILMITGSLVLGSIGMTGAAEHDFETGTTTETNIVWRWPGYVLYFPGKILDLVVAKPVGFAACMVPSFTGCTAKEQRYFGMGSDVGDWALDEAVEEDRER